MSGAGFVLAINLFIAGLFGATFTLIAAYDTARVAARWFALGFGVGTLSPILELMLPMQTDPYWVGYGIYAVIVAVLTAFNVGIALRFRRAVPWRLLTGVCLAACAMGFWIIGMPRQSMLRMVLYQAPYGVLMAIGAAIVWRSGRREPVDVATFVLLTLGALHFFSKPVLAVMLGSGSSPQTYMRSDYALFSQTMGAVLMIAIGLALILLLVRDMMVDITAKSETDVLSGLHNRRGLEQHVAPKLAEAVRDGLAASLIVCDLDHFKAINDTYGHAAGDRVIMAFSQLLRQVVPDNAAVARIGGEEFVIFLSGANLASARLCAEGVRFAFANLPVEGLPPGVRCTASFGVAEASVDDEFSDVLRRADASLYEAKKAGRDQVLASVLPRDSFPSHPFGPRSSAG